MSVASWVFIYKTVYTNENKKLPESTTKRYVPMTVVGNFTLKYWIFISTEICWVAFTGKDRTIGTGCTGGCCGDSCAKVATEKMSNNTYSKFNFILINLFIIIPKLIDHFFIFLSLNLIRNNIITNFYIRIIRYY